MIAIINRSEVSLRGGLSCVSFKFQDVSYKIELEIGPNGSIVVVQ